MRAGGRAGVYVGVCVIASRSSDMYAWSMVHYIQVLESPILLFFVCYIFHVVSCVVSACYGVLVIFSS